MAADGPPMPVLTTLTFSPASVPAQVVNSRVEWTKRLSSSRAAMRAQRPGSPGRMQYPPASP